MKVFKLSMVLLSSAFILISCGGDSSDDGGTTGGSGETQASQEKPVVTSNSSLIWLDAFEFNCESNWGERDAALGIQAYQGSGSCTMNFPGESGTYRLILKAVTEYDGRSPYKLYINGTQVAAGEYPLSSDLGCDCPLENWREVCPDLNSDIDLGTHTINSGDTLKFWADDVYPCGSHGAFAKWYGIQAVKG